LSVLGKTLDRVDVETGLQALNPDIHFDLGGKHGITHPYQEFRQGVLYHGRHICSMDRGIHTRQPDGTEAILPIIPEFKQWDERTYKVDASWGDVDQENVSIDYKVVSPLIDGFKDLYEDARAGNLEDYSIRRDGTLIHMRPYRIVRHKGWVRYVGWRHTFERIILSNIPNAGRLEIMQKFEVDMFRFPQGSQTAVYEAIWQE